MLPAIAQKTLFATDLGAQQSSLSRIDHCILDHEFYKGSGDRTHGTEKTLARSWLR